MAEPNEGVLARRRARRRRHRRNVLVAALVTVLVAGGAGTAWAMRSSGGPDYRVSTVASGTVRQTVGADGALVAHRTASAAFAAAGTVSSVAVAVGDKVTAGQPLASLDPTSLNTAVTAARTAVAQAEQLLAEDEEAQADGTSSSSATAQSQTSTATTSGATSGAGFTADAVLTSQTTTSAPTGGSKRSGGSAGGTSAGGSGGLSQAQSAVVKTQEQLDDTVSAQDQNVKTLVTSCADTGSDSSPTTVPATPTGSNNTIAGSGGSAAVVVTLLDANGDVAASTDANPQRLARNGTYSFSGLVAGKNYTVQLSRTSVISSADCTSAVTAVQKEEQKLDSARTSIRNALSALTKALASSAAGKTSTGQPSGSGGTSSTRQPATQSTGGSGQTAGTQAGTTVTAEQIAADSKSIDAARAELAVARSDRSHATLTAPITGTVAAVDLTKGDSVNAGSSTQVITLVGNGSLTIDLDISLADIDLIKAGQSAQVTVDGHTGTLPAKVTYVGQTNSSDSTGSSSTYTVSVELMRTYPSLYDGMGADVAIDVGTVANTLTVPVSAIHTTGNFHTVQIDNNGTVTRTVVTLGLIGDSVVQVKSGLKAGQRVVLADIGAAVPSSDSFAASNRRGTFGGTGGGSFGGGTGGRPGGGG